MKKIIELLLVVAIMLWSTSQVDAGLVQDTVNGPVRIEDELTKRESAVWDLLELNFIMDVIELEDIFRLEDDIHQFDEFSDEAVIELEMLVRAYVNYHQTDYLIPVREEDLPNDLK